MDLAKIRESIRQRPGMYFGTGGPGASVAMLFELVRGDAVDPIDGEIHSATVSVKTRSERPTITVEFIGFRSRPEEAKVLHPFSFVIGGSRSCRIESWNARRLTKTTYDARNRTRTSTVRCPPGSGVRITFVPSEEFSGIGHDQLCKMAAGLDDFSLLNAGTSVRLNSDLWPGEIAFYYPEGLVSWLLQNDCVRWQIAGGCLRFSCITDDLCVDGALRFLHAGVPQVRSFVNGLPTQGGAHCEGLGDALRALFPDARKGCRRVRFVTNPDTGESVELPHTFLGILSVKTRNPRFMGPTKDVLIGDEMREFVREAATATLREQWAALYPKRV
jgi:DNA gyrase/topoisomerase IV subunit B